MYCYKRFNKDPTSEDRKDPENRVEMEKALEKLFDVKYDYVRGSIAVMRGENPQNIDLTAIGVRSGDIVKDVYFISYKHLTKEGIRKCSMPLCEIGIK